VEHRTASRRRAERADRSESGAIAVPGYALYYVCEDVNGVCMYRRRDVNVPLQVTAKRTQK
jgi:hypothetical protein